MYIHKKGLVAKPLIKYIAGLKLKNEERIKNSGNNLYLINN